MVSFKIKILSLPVCLFFDCSCPHPALLVTLAPTSTQCGPGENPRIYIWLGKHATLKGHRIFLVSESRWVRKTDAKDNTMQAEWHRRAALIWLPLPLPTEARGKETKSLILPYRLMATCSKLTTTHPEHL